MILQAKWLSSHDPCQTKKKLSANGTSWYPRVLKIGSALDQWTMGNSQKDALEQYPLVNLFYNSHLGGQFVAHYWLY